MPRPRKTDPSLLLQPIVEHFVLQLAAAVEKFTVTRIAEAVKSPGGRAAVAAPGPTGKRRGRPPGRRRGMRAKTLCYYPGCSNIAAPRFGMFCAALHKNLPQSEKDKYRAQRGAKPGKGKATPGADKPRRGRPPGSKSKKRG